VQHFRRGQSWLLGPAAWLLISVPAFCQTETELPAYDEPPRIIKQTKPTYPVAPFHKRIEGTVEIEFVVDEKGRVRDAKVIKSIPDLDGAALDCVKKWKFKPATKDGRAVKAVARAPVTFRIIRKNE